MEELTKDKSIEEQIHDMELEGRILMNESYGKDHDPTIITTEDRVDDIEKQLQQIWHCLFLIDKFMEMIYNYLKGEETCPTNQESLEQKSPSSETPEVSKKP